MKPYRSFTPIHEEEHPIDALIDRRLMISGLQRRIVRATGAVMRALGDHSNHWFKLEKLLAEREAAREEAYFDTGFEQGFAAGRAEAFKESVESRITALAEELRTRALLAYELSTQERTVALLLTAWSLCISIEPGPMPADRKGAP